MKAIIAINIYAIVSVAFVLSNKVAINDMKTPLYDFIFVVNLVGTFLSGTIVCCSKNRTFKIAKSDHKIFFVRCLEGYILIVVSIIGNTLLPVTV